ncbi:MAG TPA: hypothetical protein VKM55_17170 [Candidatus Lokiarchaeia archaeon]|nr:hypothetical protein [Candidatus Lokiarchaeia archaeon]
MKDRETNLVITTGLELVQYLVDHFIDHTSRKCELMVMEQLWIMKTDGIVLFHKGTSEINSDLVGGFISAINTLASQMDENGLREIEFSQQCMLISKVNDVLFIILHDKHVKSKKVSQKLKQIIAVFSGLYPPSKIASWKGNLAEFAQLESAIAVIQ